MKHFWAGVLLLSILLGLSLWSSQVLEDIHNPIQKNLDAAAEAVLENDWEQALALANRAAADWEQSRDRIAALASHSSIEEIDSLFRQLDGFARLRDPGAYCAACRELACMAAATSEAHKFTWWNLL